MVKSEKPHAPRRLSLADFGLLSNNRCGKCDVFAGYLYHGEQYWGIAFSMQGTVFCPENNCIWRFESLSLAREFWVEPITEDVKITVDN